VHTEEISAVKYTVLQHLPVFLQKSMENGETDSQLVNSVYLDNYAMELYKGRLEKSAGAIALRFRWYGSGKPDAIYVERKTHRDSWTGEVSVKERFIIKEDQVLDLLQGRFPLEQEISRLRKKGKSEEDVREYRKLATEVIQVINSKQLVPTMRTQYMRTAFQVPFDATVRISLDTNLLMISERVNDTMDGKRWYRDPKEPVPMDEITRFPHGVLEIKLQLQDEESTPPWVSDLLHSGKLLEVHKFSKFIHGCAVLMTEDVHAVPYWIDDPTVAESIRRSDAGNVLEGKQKGANKYYKHLLPHKKGEAGSGGDRKSGDEANLLVPLIGGQSPGATSSKKKRPSNMAVATQPGKEDEINSFSAKNSMGAASGGKSVSSWKSVGAKSSNPNDESGRANWSNGEELLTPPSEGWTCCFGSKKSLSSDGDEEDEEGDDCITLCCGDWAISAKVSHMTFQKVEPKLFFANERTFMSWLTMAVLLSSASIGVLAFSSKNSDVAFFGLTMMPIALIFTIYALRIYLLRSEKIKTRDRNRWDDPFGPILISTCMIVSLSVLLLVFVIKALM
jgi:uncharacterized membrane protein YidH (DUF202 family)